MITIQGDKLNRKSLEGLFEKSADIQFQDNTFNGYRVLLVTCESMFDAHLLNEVVVERLTSFLGDFSGEAFGKKVTSQLHLPGLKEIHKKEEAISGVYEGNVLIYFEDFNKVYLSDIASKPNRKPEQTGMEMTVKGPKDNFIESLSTNIALIRKRAPTNSLCVEKFELGRRTKTTIAVMYFDDIVNVEMLEVIVGKLKKIDIDIIASGEGLMELIDERSKLFPRHDYTGRPDFAIGALARGRVVILVDGVAYGIITPVNLFLLFKTGEDSEYPSIFSSFQRFIRFSAILVGGLLPAFWLALISFHQDQLSIQLLATIVKNSTGLPLPAVLEMLLMVLMFELFREAGLRLPESIGGTLSVVGGLIIGDAAIRAGITSPTMIVIIAASVISTYTLLNQSLSGAVSLVRIATILLTAFLGLFGFFVSFFFIVLYLANMRVYGIPYLNIGEDISWSTIRKTIFRPSLNDYMKRPDVLDTQDDIRINEEDK